MHNSYIGRVQFIRFVLNNCPHLKDDIRIMQHTGATFPKLDYQN